MEKRKYTRKDFRKYWYFYTHRECVLCTRGGDSKIRIYDTPKPADYNMRHEYEQYVCWNHF